MPKGNRARPIDGREFWSSAVDAEDFLAEKVEAILPAVTHLPLRFWKPRMFFMGAEDRQLKELSEGRFPSHVVPRKTHPVFALRPLQGAPGFQVCPCSSQRPYRGKEFRYVTKGCRLLHTNHMMDRDSYLVETVRFNIPPRFAHRLRFRGEVPESCLKAGAGIRPL